MTVRADDKDIDRRLHEARVGRLAAARDEEKEARRLRHEGRDEEAIDSYNHARELYADTDLQFDDDDVMRAIKRCAAIVSNIRHPKDVRREATTPRPNCLDCGKPLRRFKQDGMTFDDGTPREWGDYGDQRFCGLRCGWRWACGHAPMPKEKRA